MGMGFEKPSMGQIQVAFELRAGAGVSDLTGLSCRAGDAAGVCGKLWTGNEDCLLALEYKVTFGEDFRKPP
jgi:hypothetical protein